jgi:hypothetical protein
MQTFQPDIIYCFVAPSYSKLSMQKLLRATRRSNTTLALLIESDHPETTATLAKRYKTEVMVIPPEPTKAAQAFAEAV